jgi:thioredoxin reductase (NADPH)
VKHDSINGHYEVIVIGAGPIGIETAGVLNRAGISYLHLEAGAVGNSIFQWPYRTTFFSSPEWIAICGIPLQLDDQGMITGEQYLAYLRQVIEILGLSVQTHERVFSISKEGATFTVQTDRLTGNGRYTCDAVVLATGDMDRRRRLGIPGEDLPHVTHRFTNPHKWFQNDLLIIGGRNSAIEAALRSWRAGARVTLSYRQPELRDNLVISRLMLEIKLLIKNGQVNFLPATEPLSFEPGVTRLKQHDGDTIEVPNDFVLVTAGFEPDNSLYESIGVQQSVDGEVPQYHEDTMETNVAGVYVAGTTSAGNQSRYHVFITTCHQHPLKILKSLRPDFYRENRDIVQGWVGNLPDRNYPLTSGDLE